MGGCHLPPGLQGICRQAVRRFEKFCFKSDVAAVSLDHQFSNPLSADFRFLDINLSESNTFG